MHQYGFRVVARGTPEAEQRQTEGNLTATAAPLSVIVPSKFQYIKVRSRPVQSVKSHPRPFRCYESDVDAEAFRE